MSTNKSVMCPFCKKADYVKEIYELEKTIFKDEEISFRAKYLLCEKCDEYFEDEDIMKENNICLKDAYREKMGLLKSTDIISIREKYGITQNDLSVLLKWGGKTITRYESFQVQDKAHDMILKKISEDPGWYIELLVESKDVLPEKSYKKYYELATKIYENSTEYYLRQIIRSNCAKYHKKPEYYGNTELSFSKIVDVIKYYASSYKVKSLYKVKLMKMMWYADFLSYKRNGHSITGLPYVALPMGAVPESHDFIIRLKDVPCEMKAIRGNDAYYFHEVEQSCPSLSSEDKNVLDDVISVMGEWSKDEIVEYMHREKAYQEPEKNSVISYEYAKYLSIG